MAPNILAPASHDERGSRPGPAGRIMFWLVVAGAGFLPWLAPRPPMVDLPQHAGQVAAAIDLLRGESPWQELLTINVFTPYVVGYGLAALLALLAPVTTVMKVLLTAAFFGFVLSAIKLREQFGGDARLDWLFVPGFFGFAYKWGFFTYLVAAPLGLLFLLLALTHSERPTRPSACFVFVLGLLLFFTHGLTFACSAGAGGLFLIVGRRRAGWLAAALMPFLALAAVLGAYLVHLTSYEAAVGAARGGAWAWDLRIERGATFFIYPWGTGENWAFVPAGLILLAGPFLIRSRWQADARAFVPFLFLAAVVMVTPTRAVNAEAIFERLGLFALPFYALMFRPPSPEESTRRLGRLVARSAGLALPVVCTVFIVSHVIGARRFAREAADFETVLDAVSPGRRALALVFDAGSPAANNGRAYLHFPLWYQAERGGLVDYNFASVAPFPLRYGARHRPAVGPGFEWSPGSFDWSRHDGARYEYFFVRRAAALPEGFFRNPDCDVSLLKAAGSWSVYEQQPRRRP